MDSGWLAEEHSETKDIGVALPFYPTWTEPCFTSQAGLREPDA